MAIGLKSETLAIHLALILLKVKAGDEVICQSKTFSVSANPILYQGGILVFVERVGYMEYVSRIFRIGDFRSN